MTAYLNQATHRRLKSTLTRATNSGDPEKILRAVEQALDAWSGKVWPDSWARWRSALDDAEYTYLRTPGGTQTIANRFQDALDRF